MEELQIVLKDAIYQSSVKEVLQTIANICQAEAETETGLTAKRWSNDAEVIEHIAKHIIIN